MDLGLLGHPPGLAEGRNQLGRARDELRGVTDAVPTVVAIPASRHRRTLQQEPATKAVAATGDASVTAVSGHIHRAFVRSLGSFTILNDGSADLPWHGHQGASYLIIDSGKLS
jgi:hypothetical protein